ncbi:MAG: hypothetical protein Ct9H90mP2_15710 [Dehalococcoidia bacterium]|nr:MAG: hypothetical protein Ct9H90mP2_15710 [Dehalococcoidia bacterium]
MEFANDLLQKLTIQEGFRVHCMLGQNGIASPIGSPFKLDAIRVPEVPHIANFLRLLFTSRGILSRIFFTRIDPRIWIFKTV